MDRCISIRYSRTRGMADTSEAQPDISGSLIRSDTSSPERYIRCAPEPSWARRISSPGSIAATPAVSLGSTPVSLAASPTVR